MPYIKESTIHPGINDCYEVDWFRIDITNRRIEVGLQKTIINTQGIPETSRFVAVIANVNAKIVDPSWDANSVPPKPEGFVLEDASTWAPIEYQDIPFVIDSTQQNFDICISSDADGLTIYERIKNLLYPELARIGSIPSGWVVS